MNDNIKKLMDARSHIGYALVALREMEEPLNAEYALYEVYRAIHQEIKKREAQ